MFIEHVNLTVSDLQRSIDFYRRLFGWDVRWQGATRDGTPAAHIGDERYYVAMFEAPQPGKWSDDYTAVGLNHFGLVVDDLEVMKQRLSELGAAHGDEQDYEPGRRIYFTDPDGIEVELVQYETAVV
jgi:catechol 2,3-dioxygenase-like lactoylglutathione lyase family enzyme